MRAGLLAVDTPEGLRVVGWEAATRAAAPMAVSAAMVGALVVQVAQAAQVEPEVVMVVVARVGDKCA